MKSNSDTSFQIEQSYALTSDDVLKKLNSDPNGQWKVTGEPTEGALRTLARKAEFKDKDDERVAVIPFESEALESYFVHPAHKRRRSPGYSDRHRFWISAAADAGANSVGQYGHRCDAGAGV